MDTATRKVITLRIGYTCFALFALALPAAGSSSDDSLSSSHAPEAANALNSDRPVLPQLHSSRTAGGSCGNSLLSPGEQCDDGNSTNGDGCSDACLVEQPNWVCTDPDTTEAEALSNPLADAITEGGFEDARGRPTTAWTRAFVNPFETPDPIICSEVQCPDIGTALTSEGIFAAAFQSGPGPELQDDRITQTVLIPPAATVLTFDLSVANCRSPQDFFEIILDGTQVYSRYCDSVTSGFEPQSVDITAFADGQEHALDIRGLSLPATGTGTLVIIDNVSIPLPTPATPVASECRQLDEVCALGENFDAGIPADWTIINLGPNATDGWGTTDDGLCLSRNAAGLPGMTNQNLGNNLTTGANGALCADSDASGQNAEDLQPGSATEMDTYICSPPLDLSTVMGPELTFNTYYQTKNNLPNDNGTPLDQSDDFDDDFLRVLVGTFPPNFLTLPNYTPVFVADDHEDDDLLLTGAQEISVNLEGTELEGSAGGFVCFHYRGTFAWFAQIDNPAVRGEDCTFIGNMDADFDGVFDSVDNCTFIPNPDQIDTNNDGIGNQCDTDINNDCITAFIDISQFTPRFGAGAGDPNYDEDFDFDSSGSLNFLDYIRMTSSFQQPPGPSANPCIPGLGD